MGGGGGGIAIIVTSSRLQVTLRVEPCVVLELSLPESDLEPSLLKFEMCVSYRGCDKVIKKG